MSDSLDRISNRAPFARQSIRLAVSSILRTMKGPRSEFTLFSTHILDADGQPLTGLYESDIANAAEAAISAFEPLIRVEDIDVEMTQAGAVAAITVHYRTADTGDSDGIRVEFPGHAGVDPAR